MNNFGTTSELSTTEWGSTGQKEIMPSIIRAANRKTFREIHQEIRTAQVQDVAQAWADLKVPHWPWLLLSPVFRVMAWMTQRSP